MRGKDVDVIDLGITIDNRHRLWVTGINDAVDVSVEGVQLRLLDRERRITADNNITHLRKIVLALEIDILGYELAVHTLPRFTRAYLVGHKALKYIKPRRLDVDYLVYHALKICR